MEIINVKNLNGASATVSLPHALYRSGIEKVSFSNKIEPCAVTTTDDDVCYISEDLLASLMMPTPIRLRALIKDDTLCFLPVIGIFTTGYIRGSARPFGTRTDDFAKFMKQAERFGAYAYLFTPDRIDWNKGAVRAVRYHNGRWTDAVAPFPQVIYDRVPNRKSEHLPKVKEAKKRFQKDFAVPWFNGGFFDKWAIFQALKAHPVSLQYLPETADLNYAALKKNLELYRTVFIKPKTSSHGIGIKRIETAKDGWICAENNLEGTVRRHYGTLENLLNAEFADHHPSQFIMQQGIQLPLQNGRPYDFRVHTNKDRDGRWHVSAVAVKIAGENRLTTHAAFGGEIKTLGEVFRREAAQERLNLLKDAALTLSEVIDQQTDDLLGELGLDLGIDADHRVWLFEANAKPGPAIFSVPSVRKQMRFVHRFLLEYATHLAELSIRKPDWLHTIRLKDSVNI